MRARWALIGLVIFAVGLAAGTYLTSRAASGSASLNATPEPVTYTVRTDVVQRAITYPATASWVARGEVFSPASGTVTAIVTAGGPLAAGETVIRVDERPVVVLPGQVPAYRPLVLGASGADVAALNVYLASLGYDVDASSGAFSTETAAAVEQWQETVGLPATGEVGMGDVVFVTPEALGTRPFRLADLSVGMPLAAGSPLMVELEPLPRIEVLLGALPPAEIEVGTPVDLSLPTGEGLESQVAELIDREGQIVARLMGPGGDALCELEDCLEMVSLYETLAASASFTLVPVTQGTVVPAQAIQTDAGGEPFVTLVDGMQRAITIVVTSGGLSVVEGLEEGTEVVLP